MAIERPTPTDNPLTLLSQEQLQQVPAIRNVVEQFTEMLPKNFGAVKIYLSPIASLLSVLRADCQAPSCGTRAIIHLARDTEGTLVLLEDKPVFDRRQNASCDNCLDLLSRESE